MMEDTITVEMFTACEPRMRQPDVQKNALAVIKSAQFIDPSSVRHMHTLRIEA